jgi:hypothetical protein
VAEFNPQPDSPAERDLKTKGTTNYNAWAQAHATTTATTR